MPIKILDGGTGRELQRLGAPFRQPEWSALALLEAPEYVLECHGNYIKSGADVITTNSYAVVPFHLGEERFSRQGKQLAQLAGKLAFDAKQHAQQSVMVAGSLPPVMGSYRPDLFETQQAQRILRVLIDALEPWVDMWLGETLSSVAEATLFFSLLPKNRPIWVSFTIDDRSPPENPRLRSGESLAMACRLALNNGAEALLFNCSQPEIMLGAVKQTNAIRANAPHKFEIGVYANAFPIQNGEEAANEHLHDIRADLTPLRYAEFAQSWVDAGATIIGGCCGIGPEHIKALSQRFSL
jgi:S-methylmethionine-dependent homocysteine/selenocysteine methylase